LSAVILAGIFNPSECRAQLIRGSLVDMSYFSRASALILLLSIPASWVIIRLSGIENSPEIQISYGRYFIVFILLFALVSFTLACIALHRKDQRGNFTKIVLIISFCALLLFGWQLTRQITNKSAYSGNASNAVAVDTASSDSRESVNSPDTTENLNSADANSQNGTGIEDQELSTADQSVLSITQATMTTVNDWGSGFNAGYECLLPGSGVIRNFLITFNYSGSARLTNGWMQGYSGGINVGNILSDGGYGIRPSDHMPRLQAGDKLSFVVQGSGSGFNAEDFDVQCSR